MFRCAPRSMPRSPSVASSAGTIDAAGNAGSQCGARATRATSQRRASSRPTPSRSRKSRSPTLLPERLRRVEQLAALGRQGVEPEPEAPVELQIRRRAEPRHRLANLPGGLGVDRVQVLLGQLPPHRVEALAARPVRLVRDRRAEHPERDLLGVDGRAELGLGARDPLLVLAGELPEMALAREAPELPDAAILAGARLERAGPLERRQVTHARCRSARGRASLPAPRSAGSRRRRAPSEAVRLLAERVELRGRRESPRHRAEPSTPPRICACASSGSRPNAGRSSSRSRAPSATRSTASTGPPRRSSSSRTRPRASRSTSTPTRPSRATSRPRSNGSSATAGGGSTSRTARRTRRRTSAPA